MDRNEVKLQMPATVAVIGAGPSGLSMLKTLREDGFAATLFERRNRVGGLWSYTDDPTMTSALPTTLANISKYTCGYTDFPIPDEYPAFMTQEHFQEYMESYVAAFDLNQYIVFDSSVKRVVRNPDGTRWQVEMIRSGNEEVKEFDKVVFCHGFQTVPKIPTFEGQEKFEGEIMHSQQFRKAEDMKDKTVLFVGIGATASDIVPVVVPHAAKTYISHRKGAWVILRWRNGLPVDLLITRAKRQASFVLQKYFPSLSVTASQLAFRYITKSFGDFGLASRLLDNPTPLTLSSGITTDDVLNLMRDGKLVSVHRIRRFLGGKSVEFTDGTVLHDVDTIICCTGYKADFDVAPFVEMSQPATDGKGHAYGGPPIARLFMNTFPPAHADSIAMLTYSALGKSNGFGFADVASMAVSGVWRNQSNDLMPSRAEMERKIDQHHAWIAHRWHVFDNSDVSAVKQYEYHEFLHKAAGTGMENLGWGWKGWLFWVRDPKMSMLMNHGVETAHAFRYFETGKRKAWPGAREAIIHMNEVVKQLKKKKV